MDKRFITLAIVSDHSSHPAWLADEPVFDTFLVYSGNQGQRYKDSATFYEQVASDSRDDKFLVLANVIAQYWELLATYDVFWFPDDNLTASSTDINRLFRLFDGHALKAGQPMWGEPEGVKEANADAQPATLMRFVDKVGTHAPLFSKAQLIEFHPSFSECTSEAELTDRWHKTLSLKYQSTAVLNISGLSSNAMPEREEALLQEVNCFGELRFHPSLPDSP